MACEKCEEFEGDSITHYSSFIEIFEVIKHTSSSMIEAGVGNCRFCNQKIVYYFDETLIPKLRIEFVNTYGI